MNKLQCYCFFLLLVCFISCTPTTAKDQSSTTIPEATVANEIKSIESYTVDIKTGNKTLTSTAHYKNNLPIKIYTYKNGQSQEERYSYNADGKVTEYSSLDEEGKLTYSNVCIYDGKNKIEERNNYEAIKSRYNAAGHLIEVQEYDADGTFNKAQKMVYDYQGDLVVKIETYSKRGDRDFQLYEEQLFSYNKQGLVEKEKSRAVFGSFEYAYTYHPNGKEKEKTTLAYEGKEKIVTQYDDEGRRVLENIYRRKSVEEGFQLDRINRWAYDQQGSEVSAESLRNGQLISRRIREITYY